MERPRTQTRGAAFAYPKLRMQGFSRALDCDPEIAEIDVKYRKEDNWGTGFDETEVEDIIILD